MNVKLVVAAVAASVLLVAAACSREPEQPIQRDTGVEASRQAPDGTRRGKEKSREPLPERIALDFRNQLRNDRIVERKGRKSRRKVVLEYLEGNQTSTFDSIQRSLDAAGFTLRDRKQMENGNVRTKFDKRGYGTIIVTITADMDVTARNPAALGRVILDMPVARGPSAQEE